MTVKVAQPTLDNFHGKIVPSMHRGQASKVKVVMNQQGVPAAFNGPTEPSFADRQQRFDEMVANQQGVKLSDISQNIKIVGTQVFDSLSGELINEIKPSDSPLITPSVRNACIKGSGRVGSPTLNRVEPSQDTVGSRTSFVPAHVVEAEPAVAPSETSAVARRIRKLEAALEGLVAEIKDLKNNEDQE